MNTNLLDNSIALSLSISKIGIRRKVDSRKVMLREGQGDEPEKDAIAVNKELISTPSFDAIIKLDNEFRNSIYKLALPNPLFRNGTYLIPVSLVESIDGMIESFKVQRQEKIDLFLDDYTNAVYDARKRLGGLFDIGDYPSKESVAGSFQVIAQYIEIGLPSTLGAISPSIFQREKKLFEEKMVSAAEEITAAMRESFKELVDHMVDRLKPGDDGKPKIFRDSLVSNFRDFLSTFDFRNITNDEQLESLVNKARQVLNGKSAADLRTLDNVRNDIVKGMSDIKESLSTMIVDAPKRKFSFDD